MNKKETLQKIDEVSNGIEKKYVLDILEKELRRKMRRR